MSTTTLSGAVFRRTRVVTPADIDELGHVNNIVWLRFVVELGHAHSDAVGLTRERYEDLGVAWVVRRHLIEYQRPAPLGLQMQEETWVSEMRGARSVRQARFTATASGILLVHATSEWAFVDRRTQRPRRMPEAIRDCFAVVAQPFKPLRAGS